MLHASLLAPSLPPSIPPTCQFISQICQPLPHHLPFLSLDIHRRRVWWTSLHNHALPVKHFFSCAAGWRGALHTLQCFQPGKAEHQAHVRLP